MQRTGGFAVAVVLAVVWLGSGHDDPLAAQENTGVITGTVGHPVRD